MTHQIMFLGLLLLQDTFDFTWKGLWGCCGGGLRRGAVGGPAGACLRGLQGLGFRGCATHHLMFVGLLLQDPFHLNSPAAPQDSPMHFICRLEPHHNS